MSQFIESFFDTNVTEFKLWSKDVAKLKIDPSEVIFSGPMFKKNRKNLKLKERFFVLTQDNFYYLKNSKSNKIRCVMDTKWVRVEYIKEEGD